MTLSRNRFGVVARAQIKEAFLTLLRAYLDLCIFGIKSKFQTRSNSNKKPLP